MSIGSAGFFSFVFFELLGTYAGFVFYSMTVLDSEPMVS